VRYFLFLLLFTFSFQGILVAQKSGDDNAAKKPLQDYRYAHEFSGGIKIHTNGFSLNLTKGWIKNIYTTHLVQAEYQYFINYRDKRVATNPSYVQGGRKYYYGLQNRFHALRFSYGFERALADKADRNGVRLSFIGFAGLSLGLLKPYYLEMVKYRDSITGDYVTENVKYNGGGADDRFMSQDSIYQAAPFYKGMGQIVPTVGGHIKAGLSFDWGSMDKFVKALEAGVMLDVYYRKVPIYVNSQSNSLFSASLYLGFRFGKRW
jgi:hypothetical protein